MPQPLIYAFQPSLDPVMPPEVEEPDFGYPAFFPAEAAAMVGPDQSKFACAVAWTFSRASERREGYYIGRGGAGSPYAWVLWRLEFDDNWETWTWSAYAATKTRLKSAEEAAKALLGFGWGQERMQWDQPPPDEVEEDGLLHTIEVEDITSRVWGVDWRQAKDAEEDDD